MLSDDSLTTRDGTGIIKTAVNRNVCAVVFVFIFTLASFVITPATLYAQTEEALEWRVQGFHAQQRGSLEEAMDFYKRAGETDPTYATPHNDLGVVYEDLGRLAEAEYEYRQAVTLDPNYAGAYTNLASLYDRQGRYTDSLPLWRQRARMGDEGDRWRTQAQQRIQELEATMPSLAPKSSAETSPVEVSPKTEMEMAAQIAGEIATERAVGTGSALPAPTGYTTVKMPAGAGGLTGLESDWYARTEESKKDLAHREAEVAKLGPEVHARYLVTQAEVALAADDYQRAVDLLARARALDPDEVKIDQLYEKAREKQIEDDIARAAIDSSVYNRRKMIEVEKKWFPPKPEAVEPFDKSKYIVKGSEKSPARDELEKKAKQVVPSIDFTDAKLKDVIEFLAVSNDINIVIDGEAVSADERVTVHLTDIPLEEALDVILRAKGLKYRLEENIIWITSAERLLEEDLEVRVYDVQDLVGKIYDFPSEPFDFEKFVEAEKS